MASTEGFYGGNDYGFDPSYGITPDYGSFTGYHVPASQIGITSDPRTANQLAAVSKRLFTGIKNVEVNSVNIMGGGPMKMIDSIPKDQFKEIARLKKLTGAELTFHGPLVEPTGISRQGWDESQRQLAETEIFSAVKRSHDLDPNGNIVVTLHSSNGLPEPESTIIDEKTGEKVTTSMYFVNEKEGTFTSKGPIQKDYFRDEDYKGMNSKEIILEQAKSDDKKSWAQALQHANFNAYASQNDFIKALSKKEGVMPEEQQQAILKAFKDYIKSPEQFEKSINELKSKNPEEAVHLKERMLTLTHGDIYLREAYQDLQNLYNIAYESAERSDNKRDLNMLNEYKNVLVPTLKKIEDDPSKLNEFKDAIIEGVNVLRKIETPQRLTPLREFAIEQAGKTFGNTAFKAFKEFKDTSPIISIENPPVGMGLTTGEDLRDLVKTSRQQFVNRAKEELHLSESEAQKQADKLIGVTWDVGHINMMRKYGYEEKDIIEQAKKVAPMVKHVHLSDNFGLEHTELPMGMGNVPTKKHLELINKYNKQAKKIIEAAEWQSQGGLQQPTSPVRETLTALGSPVFGTAISGPYWNQISSASGNYYTGFGAPTNPSWHHQNFGAGFSNIPVELGGQMAGQSRASGGTPFE